MVKKGRKEAEMQIEQVFKNIKDKTPGDVRKMKKLAMSYNIKLRDKKKTFCEKCLCPYKEPKIRLKKKMKIVVCGQCGCMSKWRVA